MSNVTDFNKPERPDALVFGEHDQWAVTVDDGCLLFHPNYQNQPEIVSKHIWREAFLFVFEQGGFDAVRDTMSAG